MQRLHWKPGTVLSPLPAVMVTCGSTPENYNIITIAWVGIICSDPPMCSISIRPERHSYKLIKETLEFVINVTTQELAFATDWCGVKSGKDVDKFKEMKLTPIAAQIVKVPLIKESPVNIECIVQQIIPLGTHDLFIAKIVAVNADPQYLNEETGKFNIELANPICYSSGFYHLVGKQLGKFGFSVEKTKKKLRKRRLK